MRLSNTDHGELVSYGINPFGIGFFPRVAVVDNFTQDTIPCMFLLVFLEVYTA